MVFSKARGTEKVSIYGMTNSNEDPQERLQI